MSTVRSKLPSYRLHKASGQAVVTLAGRDVYLGPHGTRLSRDNYDRVVAEWLAGGRRLREAGTGPGVVSVVEVANAFRKSGLIPSSHADCYRAVIELLARLYGRTPASEFGPLALKAVRERMVAAGWNRRTVNDRVHVTRRIFRWAAEQEMVPGSVPQALGAVAGLRAGQGGAPEPSPVEPVPPERVAACLPHMPEVVRDMVRLQLLTGMRPGEVVILRPTDVDTSREVWVYRPTRHKSQWSGKQREVAIGPKAQEVLASYLDRDALAFCFSPSDSERKRRADAHEARSTPLSCGNRPGTNRTALPRRFRDAYDVPAYRLAIYRGADKAFLPPAKLARARGETEAAWRRRLGPRWAELLAWRDAHRWHPHQLRHTFATDVRRRFGLEHTQVSLGHAHAKVTERYAAVALEKAVEVAQVLG